MKRDSLPAAILRILWWGGELPYPALRLLASDASGTSAANAAARLRRAGYIREVRVRDGGGRNRPVRVIRLSYGRRAEDYAHLLYEGCQAVYDRVLMNYLRDERPGAGDRGEAEGSLPQESPARARGEVRARASRGLRLGETAAFLYGPASGAYRFALPDGRRFDFVSGRFLHVYPGEGKPPGAVGLRRGMCAAYLTYEVKNMWVEGVAVERGLSRAMSGRLTGLICDGNRFYTVYMISSPLGVAVYQGRERLTNDMLFRIVNERNEETRELFRSGGQEAPGMRGAFFVLRHYSVIRTLGSGRYCAVPGRGRGSARAYLNVTSFMDMAGIGGHLREMYALPFAREGRALLSILLYRSGKDILERGLPYLPPPGGEGEWQVLRREESPVWHAVRRDGTLGWSFLAAELTGLQAVIQDLRALREEGTARPVEIACYDFQEEDLLSLVKGELGEEPEGLRVRTYAFSGAVLAFQLYLNKDYAGAAGAMRDGRGGARDGKEA